MMKNPPLTNEPVQYVECTPDEDYPVRILQAHLQHACCSWEVHGLDEATRQIYDAMNEANERRRDILERAIRCLKKERLDFSI